MEAIKVTDLDVAYEQKYIIKNMNLEIPKGKITMIIGSNGCGKSTLLKTIARIITPKKGEIQLNGVSIQQQACCPCLQDMYLLHPGSLISLYP